MASLPLEKEIQDHISNKLRERGENPQLEVSVPGGRADIVTDDTVYEVKRELNREAIFQAHGQAQGYAYHLKKPKIVLIGFAPSDKEKLDEALSAQKVVERDNVHVVFIDPAPEWGWKDGSTAPAPFPTPVPSPTPTTPKDSQRPNVGTQKREPDRILEFFIVLIIAVVGVLVLRFSQRPPALPPPQINIRDKYLPFQPNTC